MPAFQNLTGQTFGRLTVIARVPSSVAGKTRWQCQCICGMIKAIQADSLTSKKSQSCGCLNREMISQRRKIHGRSRTPEYNIYINIVQRCTNPRSQDWKSYGGRGITVEWTSFEQFFAARGPRPSPEHTIERIDNNGPYSSQNTRWIPFVEQGSNRRDNHTITYQGLTMTMAQWTRHLGYTPSLISGRLLKGWTIERALTPPRSIRTKLC